MIPPLIYASNEQFNQQQEGTSMFNAKNMGLMTGLLLVAAASAAVAFPVKATNTPTIEAAVLDSVAPWVTRTVRIPIYVDGQLWGYLEYDETYWVSDKEK